ncbi:MAG: dipicolinate synthase subunit B [Oscillospiraceae bacterium]|nr:dipicolinate synthase subunit B [Oscillospiraceae bacterium]
MKKIAFAVTGSFCTFSHIPPVLEALAREYEVTPIFSRVTASLDTRFGTAADFREKVVSICGREPLTELTEVEPIGPRRLFDAVVVAPCTGSALSALASGSAVTAVTLACKAQLRNGGPVLLAVSSNDALSGNAKNLGELLARRGYFFVPFRQDDPEGKPASLVAEFSLIPAALAAALAGRQLQPLLLGPQ